MAQWHLDDLRQHLIQNGWIIAQESEGDGYRISGTWIITCCGSTQSFHIDFHGLDDMKTLPIEQSYGCHVRERPSISLYFGKHGDKASARRNKWKDNLAQFVTQLNIEEPKPAN